MENKMMPWMKKNAFTVGLTAALAVSVGALAFVANVKPRKTTAQMASLAKTRATLESELAAAKAKYAGLEADRNNVLEQTKHLLAERTKLIELEETHAELEKANAVITQQKDKLLSVNEKLRGEREGLSADLEKTRSLYEALRVRSDGLEQSAVSLKRSLSERVQNAPEFKALSGRANALQAENAKQKAAIQSLNSQLEKTLDRNKKIAGRELKMKKQILNYEKNLRQLKKENQKLVTTNRQVNQATKQAPVSLNRMAQENKALKKETSEMHYNLGVFYTRNQNVSMAVFEYERALKINPKNAKAHYNLGYLYAEELDQHDKALAHFQRYLDMNPQAKESEPLRQYLLERNTMGNKPARIR